MTNVILNDIINDVVATTIKTIQEDENRKKIEDKILEPLIKFILDKIKPYILITGCFFIILTALIITIMILVICNKK